MPSFLFTKGVIIQMRINKKLVIFLAMFGLLSINITHAEEAGHYKIRQGDVLDVSVWGDKTLDKEIRVLPDGSISFPLAGQVVVAGNSPAEVAARITAKLKTYLPDPEVTVIVRSTDGNRVYIIGKVNTPGAIPLQGPMTVLQALSISGGFDRFASLDDIKILRETPAGQKVLDVHYNDLIRGKNLDSNYRLQADDTILVP